MATTQPTLTPRSSRVGAVREDRTVPRSAQDTSAYNTMAHDVEWIEGVESEPTFPLTTDRASSNAHKEVAHTVERPRTLMDAVTRGQHAVSRDTEPVWRIQSRQTGRAPIGRPSYSAAVQPGKEAAADTVIPAKSPHGSHGQAAAPGRRWPAWILVNLAMLAVVGLGLTAQRFLPADAAAACDWHTVVRNDTLGNLGYFHHTTAMAIAQANHIANPNRIYVGQKLCIPTATWAAAPSAPAVPQSQTLAVTSSAPASAAPAQGALPAGEPCTDDRSIVWTVPVSRWAVPPGCFGGVYSPNPNNFLVNGHVIPGFGWCNWWPEALLRDPNAIFRPGHSAPRVGVPVYWAPQPGDKTGHYGFVESIGPNGWILISEMNMYWRGAGWAKVDYRYIRVDYPGASYLYY